jgi:predicted membrane-bound spermidine synthase
MNPGGNLRRFEVLIFLTGAVTLALEVLSSRIMTPYFGVSLYIWSGILSITLAFLALGYSYGGKLSQRLSGADLESRFLMMPVISAASIGGAALIYPFLLALLSQVNLVLGSFVGATLILALPLIALSAMNPLLIGMQRETSDKGDAGAGRVFFISTVGSVVGVLLTAFVLIPAVTNYRGILALGIALCLCSIVFAVLSPSLPGDRKRRIIIAGVCVGIFCSALSVFKEAYINLASLNVAGRPPYEIKQEYTSLFGNIKVADFTRGGNAPVQKLLVNDGLMQSNTTTDNLSLSHYSYVFDALGRAYAPHAKDALVLGLGAGVVPRDFKDAGMKVAVVDINQDILTAAVDHFGFDPSGYDVHVEDARTYVRRCKDGFDLGVIDLFLGDNTPDYLLTREFFADVRRCIRSSGVIIVNAYLDETDEGPNKKLFATLATAFPRLFLYGLRGGNAFVVGTEGSDATRFELDPARFAPNMLPLTQRVLESKREIPARYYAGVEPVSDDHNVFSMLFSSVQMDVRRMLARQLTFRMLVN